MNTETPQTDLDMNDPYQWYIYMMLVVVCDRCETYLDITPPYGDDKSWDWYRRAANQARDARWYLSTHPLNNEGLMTCLCPSCKTEAEPCVPASRF